MFVHELAASAFLELKNFSSRPRWWSGFFRGDQANIFGFEAAIDISQMGKW